MAFFGHFWAKNGVFGDRGSETLNDLHQNLAKHVFQNRVRVLTSDHSGPTNTVLGQKLEFFWPFLVLKMQFFSCWRLENTS